MKTKKFSLIGAAIALLITGGFLFSSDAFGDNRFADFRPYLITPTVRIGEVSGGYSYSGTFTLVERADIAGTVQIYTDPYSVHETEYTPVYNSAANSYRNSIKDWITFPEGTQFDIAAGEEITIPYIINIPKNALGGSQYCAIIIEPIRNPSASPDGDAPINTIITGRVALPIFADIIGDGMLLSGELISWNVNSIFLSPPLKGDFTIKNTGNIIFSVNYKFEVFDFFRGGDSVYTDESSKSVFPDTQRTINHAWEEAPLLGLFRVKEKISFLGTSEDFSKLVLIIPLFLIILILIILALGITLIVYRHRTRKQEKKRLAKTHDL